MKEYSYKEMYLINKFEKNILENTMNKLKDSNKIIQNKPILKDATTETSEEGNIVPSSNTINETETNNINKVEVENNETDNTTNVVNVSNLSSSQKRKLRKRKNEKIVKKRQDKSFYDTWNVDKKSSVHVSPNKNRSEKKSNLSLKDEIKKKIQISNKEVNKTLKDIDEFNKW